MTGPGWRPLIMGILNVTPDSFSDGGSWTDTAAAIAHGLQMSAHGADILDVGGESTRPCATRLPANIQIERVLPVIHGINDCLSGKVNLSIDTTLATVAEAAIAPAMRPTVMQANIAWNATNAIAGTPASGSSTMRPSSPMYCVTFPSNPAWPYELPNAIEYP